jgi:TolB-like protein
MSIFEELKRRNVFRVAIAYLLLGWAVLQGADFLLDLVDAPGWVIKVFAIAGLVGFPFALFFAWAYELTPEGVKREKDVDRSRSVTPQTGKKLNAIIMGLLVVAVALLAADRMLRSPGEAVRPQEDAGEAAVAAVDTPAPVADGQSVAVLPFVAMSSGEDDEYFADGLTEEILNALAQLPELLVTARTSAFYFKGQDIPVPEIAARLGVRHIVEGSVRRAGERARITAQLIRAEDGFHLWSETYDRTLEDILAVQEEIAAGIAAALDVVLDDDKRRLMREAGIGDVEAFIAYQKGLEAFARAHGTKDPGALLPEANHWFDAALATVPDVYTALYLRTDLYGHVLYNHATGIESADPEVLDSALQEIRSGLQRAMRAAPSEAQRNILDVERTLFMDDWTGVRAKLDRAFVPGDCSPLNWMPDLAVPYGWAEQAVRHVREEMRCDPLSGYTLSMQMWWELWNGTPELALQAAERFTEEVGHHPWIDDARFLGLLATGRYREHPELSGPNPDGSSYQLPRKIYLYAFTGDLDRARAILRDWQADQTSDDLSLSNAAAALGDRALANEHAGRMDARVGGNLALAELVKSCMCGAPFDLDATPNFRARIEEAGFAWPPPTVLKYPAKDW